MTKPAFSIFFIQYDISVSIYRNYRTTTTSTLTIKITRETVAKRVIIATVTTKLTAQKQ